MTAEEMIVEFKKILEERNMSTTYAALSALQQAWILGYHEGATDTREVALGAIKEMGKTS